MTTKHTPSTPLPWREAKAGEIGTTVFSGEHSVASTDTHRWTAGEREIQDAAYIAHAANAYPKLISYLHAMAGGLHDKEIRALLRELGEL